MVVATLALLACGRPTGPAGRVDPLAHADSTIRAQMRAQGIPGMAVALVQTGGATVRGFGVADGTGTPVSDSTLFQLGSVTKVLTAMIVAALAERDVVRLDAPVGTYLPDLPPWASQLTLHRLLSHTAGLRDQPADSGSHDEAALRDFVRGWRPNYALLPAGLVFSYSNPGYALAGATIEAAARTPFADLVQHELLTPLGMRDAAIRPAAVRRRLRATGHTGRPGTPPIPLTEAADDTRFWPAGYVHASGRDVARFLEVMLNDGRLDGRRVLPAQVTRRLRQPVVPLTVEPAGSWYGYGVILERRGGEERVWHDGAMPGFTALIALFPGARSGVAVLANREGAALRGIADAVLGLEADPAATPPSGVPVPVSVATRLLGRYVNRWTFELALAADSLVLRRFGETLPVAQGVGGRYLAVSPTGAVDEFRMFASGAGRPDCLLMYLWAFCRESPRAAGDATFQER